MKVQQLDKRYKDTLIYLSTGKGEPVYKRRAFSSFIDKILGPQYKWIDKSPEQYFGDNQNEEIQKAIHILGFTGKETFKDVRRRYHNLSKGYGVSVDYGFHPDYHGHGSAFAILNHAYNVFKQAHEEEN